MGACATKFKVLKDAGDVPAPAEEVEAEVKKEEAVVDDEAKRQSLGHLFKENEEHKDVESVQEKHEDAAEVKPQENDVKSIEPVVDVPLNPETSEEKKTEEKLEDKLVIEPRKVERPEETKPDEKVVPVKETETEGPDANRTEEPKASSDAEKAKD